jgi:hypothetical protein
MNVDIFATYLVKLYKFWLWLNPERRVNKNGGSNQIFHNKILF